MNCEEALVLISGYLDGTNTDAEMAQLRTHLEDCVDCRQVLQTLKELEQGVASLEEEPPADLKETIMNEIRMEAKQTRRLRLWVPVAAAAALLLVVGIGGLQPEIGMNAAKTASIQADTAAPAAYSRRIGDIPAHSIALDSQIIADRLGAYVTETRELLPEMETCPCETLEDGSLLYQLPDSEAAKALSEYYDLALYCPTEEKQFEVSYARLIS